MLLRKSRALFSVNMNPADFFKTLKTVSSTGALQSDSFVKLAREFFLLSIDTPGFRSSISENKEDVERVSSLGFELLAEGLPQSDMLTIVAYYKGINQLRHAKILSFDLAESIRKNKFFGSISSLADWIEANDNHFFLNDEFFSADFQPVVEKCVELLLTRKTLSLREKILFSSFVCRFGGKDLVEREDIREALPRLNLNELKQTFLGPKDIFFRYSIVFLNAYRKNLLLSDESATLKYIAGILEESNQQELSEILSLILEKCPKDPHFLSALSENFGMVFETLPLISIIDGCRFFSQEFVLDEGLLKSLLKKLERSVLVLSPTEAYNFLLLAVDTPAVRDFNLITKIVQTHRKELLENENSQNFEALSSLLTVIQLQEDEANDHPIFLEAQKILLDRLERNTSTTIKEERDFIWLSNFLSSSKKVSSGKIDSIIQTNLESFKNWTKNSHEPTLAILKIADSYPELTSLIDLAVETSTLQKSKIGLLQFILNHPETLKVPSVKNFHKQSLMSTDLEITALALQINRYAPRN